MRLRFYEWKKDGSRKQPYYIHFKDGRPLVFAALYDSWQNSEGKKFAEGCKELTLSIIKDHVNFTLYTLNVDVILLTAGETLYTFTIVTTSSSSTLQWLHGESCALNVGMPKKFQVDIIIYEKVKCFLVCIKSTRNSHEYHKLYWKNWNVTLLFYQPRG